MFSPYLGIRSNAGGGGLGDRAGEAKKSTFDFLSMDALIELVSFSLL